MTAGNRGGFRRQKAEGTKFRGTTGSRARARSESGNSAFSRPRDAETTAGDRGWYVREGLKPSGRPAQAATTPPFGHGSAQNSHHPLVYSTGATSCTETVPKHNTATGTHPPACLDSRRSGRLTAGDSPPLSPSARGPGVL